MSGLTRLIEAMIDMPAMIPTVWDGVFENEVEDTAPSEITLSEPAKEPEKSEVDRMWEAVVAAARG